MDAPADPDSMAYSTTRRSRLAGQMQSATASNDRTATDGRVS
ncbi:hypothetical protein [Halorussus limi]|nr:hypothetical protein [Halorussus limi]